MKTDLFYEHYIDVDDDCWWFNLGYLDSGQTCPVFKGWDVRKMFFEEMDSYTEPSIIDVGAGIGGYTLLAAKHPGASIVAFEPMIEAHNLLLRNILRAGISDRAAAFRVALWKGGGVKLLRVPNDRRNASKATLGEPLWVGSYEERKVGVRSIDDVIDTNMQVDLMKINANGAELMVLEGAEKTILRQKPDMLIKFHPNDFAQFEYGLRDMEAKLNEWGANHEIVGYTWLWVTWPEEPWRSSVTSSLRRRADTVAKSG